VFRDLARRFPGCLNELDTLPLDEVDARAAALAGAAAGGPVEPWMAWIAGYHALVRAALWIKGRRPPPGISADEADRLAEAARTATGVAVGRAFVQAVADPPRGRLVEVVLGALTEIHGTPDTILRGAIFPRHRR
jgi:hypothetical protein